MISRAREAPQSKSRLDLAELDLPEIEARPDARGASRPSMPVRSIAGFIAAAIDDLGQMTDLSRPLRDPAAGRVRGRPRPAISSEQLSTDGTRKFVLELADGRQIESVFIPDTPAMTFCVSTQVGCAMSCGFCLTGKMGLVRNLTRR